MTKNEPVDAMSKIVEILTPLSSEERVRVMHAAMVLLGESESPQLQTNEMKTVDEEIEHLKMLSPRARAWMKQNNITIDELQQVFHVTESEVTVIAPHIPGKGPGKQTLNAYILTGIAQLLMTGTPLFEDKSARALCESSGCYDSANHAATLKKKGNEFTGSKKGGWTLTAPGLKSGAGLIKELNKEE